MIPTFPKFKKLSLDDRKEIESFTSKFPPYSDFNFVSLWSWDTETSLRLTKLNNNLVIKFKDYMTQSHFFSFLGLNKVNQTIYILVEYAKKINIDTSLHLMPENVVRSLAINNKIKAIKDRNNFDYIISIQSLVRAEGKENKNERYLVRRFIKLHKKKVKVIDIKLNNAIIKEKILNLFFKWELKGKKEREETKNELQALKKLLKYANKLHVQTLGMFRNNELIGFVIYEKLHNAYGLIHFEKADLAYSGIFQYLRRELALKLQAQGSRYINYEQDLGIIGLRRAKLSLPVNFLKKYTISLKK